jgi:hypothetical protein
MWRASPFYSDGGVAHFWNRKPSELGLCEPDEDPALMKAYYQTVKDMEAYEGYLQQKQAENNRPKGKRR